MSMKELYKMTERELYFFELGKKSGKDELIRQFRELLNIDALIDTKIEDNRYIEYGDD